MNPAPQHQARSLRELTEAAERLERAAFRDEERGAAELAGILMRSAASLRRLAGALS